MAVRNLDGVEESHLVGVEILVVQYQVAQDITFGEEGFAALGHSS